MMKTVYNRFIQIAGVIDKKEADLLVECGIKYLGFPLRLPVNKEDLTEADASKIISELVIPAKAILITYLSDANEIIKFCEYMNVDIVQLHGFITVDELAILKSEAPKLSVIKSLVVKADNKSQLEKNVEEMYEYVDAFITDTFDPTTGASGATGKTHDWNVSKMLVQLSPKPVILAGGLNPDNVYDAIKFVKPAGVDTHTGVELPNGRKDSELVKSFLLNANKAFDELNYQ